MGCLGAVLPVGPAAKSMVGVWGFAPEADDTFVKTSGYSTLVHGRGAIRIAHYDVIDDVITRKL